MLEGGQRFGKEGQIWVGWVGDYVCRDKGGRCRFLGKGVQSEGGVHAEALRSGHGGRSEESRGRGSPLEKGWTSTQGAALCCKDVAGALQEHLISGEKWSWLVTRRTCGTGDRVC